MKIIIAPYAAKLRNGLRNPKDYPHFAEVVTMLHANGHKVVQIGVTGEDRIEGVDQFITDWPFVKIRELIAECAVWVSGDSFLSHLCHYYRLQPGVVLWGKSNPQIFGYPSNENLFVSESNFRQFPYDMWEAETYDESVFVPPRQVIWAVERLIKRDSASVESSYGVRLVPRGVQLATEEAVKSTS